MLLFQMLSRVDVAALSGVAKIIPLYGIADAEDKFKYRRRQILCRRLKLERSIVSVRVAPVPRSAEIKLSF